MAMTTGANVYSEMYIQNVYDVRVLIQNDYSKLVKYR